jgi:hypothetical protein
MIKIINLILRYSVGKELVIGNRSTRTGRYTKRVQEVKTTRAITVHDYIHGDYIINL